MPATGPTITSGLVSNDGRVVVFNSTASNLVLGDRNSGRDVFCATARPAPRCGSARPGAAARPTADSHVTSLSPDSRFVLFDSDASNLVPGDTNGASDVFLYGPIQPFRRPW